MAYQKDNYIAVFDSGVGGVSVLRQLVRQLPGERFVYFGDSGNAPYGSRPIHEIRALSLAVARQLTRDYPVKALVVACNTATAAAITTLREEFPQIPVIGIEPALKLAADTIPGGHLGVMATEVTLREEKFNRLAQRVESTCRVERIPAPGLVQLIEAGKADSPETEAFLQQLLGPWRGKLDALVLGCTHYPFAARAIRRVLGEEVLLLDGGEGTAREVRRRLEQLRLLSDGPGEVIFETSGDSRIIGLCRKLLEAR